MQQLFKGNKWQTITGKLTSNRAKTDEHRKHIALWAFVSCVTDEGKQPGDMFKLKGYEKPAIINSNYIKYGQH